MDTRRTRGAPDRKLPDVLEGLMFFLLPVQAKCNISKHASMILFLLQGGQARQQPLTNHRTRYINIITLKLRVFNTSPESSGGKKKQTYQQRTDTCSTEVPRITLFSRLGWKTEMLMARIPALASRSRIPPASMNRVKPSSASRKPAFIAHA